MANGCGPVVVRLLTEEVVRFQPTRYFMPYTYLLFGWMSSSRPIRILWKRRNGVTCAALKQRKAFHYMCQWVCVMGCVCERVCGWVCVFTTKNV